MSSSHIKKCDAKINKERTTTGFKKKNKQKHKKGRKQ